MKGTEKIRELRCPQAKRLLSPYLDGVVRGTEMLALQDHLSDCAACQSEYQALRRTQQLLARVRRPQAPEDLGLRLRVAISREAAAARAPFQGLLVRLENSFQAFMVPATAGFLSALVIFGIAMAYFVAPASLQADNDVPLVMVNTAPQLQPSSFGVTMDTIDDDSLVIEAYVGANGRVQDYRVLSDPSGTKELPPHVKTMLLDFMTFTTYRPALSMGRPTPSRAVLSFSKISVKG
ncbi:MAG: anti-sigma factor family protein [Terriglobales bacterium]